MREMATSPEYRHVPTGRLAMLAERMGRVFVSTTTWYRLIRERRWRRPRWRVHPGKPKDGIRATSPDQLWHVDMTVIRLIDKSKGYLHAIIDNYSRRILSWRLLPHFDAGVTADLMVEAGQHLPREAQRPTLLSDGGVEKFNGAVDALVNEGALRRVLAQVDNSYSNSLIEAWATAQAPVALHEQARHDQGHPQARGVLRRRAQHAHPPCRVQGSDT